MWFLMCIMDFVQFWSVQLHNNIQNTGQISTFFPTAGKIFICVISPIYVLAHESLYHLGGFCLELYQ